MAQASDYQPLNESDALPALDDTLSKFLAIKVSQVGLRDAQVASWGTARVLAERALAATDSFDKLVLALAAGYAAAFFGLPRNEILETVDRVVAAYGFDSHQRGVLHQQAARTLQKYVVALKKGNAAMSGVFRDGVLGASGSAYKDGSLGAIMMQPGAFQDGALGLSRRFDPTSRRMRRPLMGLGAGCGCSGFGADEAAKVAMFEMPIYKNPAYIAGGVALLGIVLYVATKKR